jgi:dihydroorotase
MQTLKITRPDDFHLHLRDGAEMKSVVIDSARQFARAIIMPNLKPPIVTTAQAMDYRERILACLPEDCPFQPLMTLYLTDQTTPEEIDRASQSGYIYGVKYYPAGATTNSEIGVTAIENVYLALEKMVELDMPLLVHGEVTDDDVDMYDREYVFIERVLIQVLEQFKKLRVVFEHITTSQAVEFVKNGPDTLAATVTPQHLLLNRDALYSNGDINPHHYCLPVLKAEEHRQAVLEAAMSGHPGFFLGTDSAPHAKTKKESDCGCAGIYSAHAAIELYASIFDTAGWLDRLEPFASHYGADFYGLPRNETTITLEKKEWTIPATLPFADEQIVPFRAGEKCTWKLQS